MASDAYKAKIEKWMSRNSSCQFPMELFEYGMADGLIYSLGKLFVNSAIKSNKDGKGEDKPSDEDIWLTPYSFGSTVGIVDRYSHKVRDGIYKGFDSLSWNGPERDIPRYAGRGGIHQIAMDLDDNSMFAGFGKN